MLKMATILNFQVLRSQTQESTSNTFALCAVSSMLSFHVFELGREIPIKIKAIHCKFTATRASISYVLVSKPGQGGNENI